LAVRNRGRKSSLKDMLNGAPCVTGCGKTRSAGGTACPTALQVVDRLWWGRRFRLPIRSFEEFFRSLVSMRVNVGKDDFICHCGQESQTYVAASI